MKPDFFPVMLSDYEFLVTLTRGLNHARHRAVEVCHLRVELALDGGVPMAHSQVVYIHGVPGNRDVQQLECPILNVDWRAGAEDCSVR